MVLKGEHLTMFKEIEVLGVTADTEVFDHALKVLHVKLLKKSGKGTYPHLEPHFTHFISGKPNWPIGHELKDSRGFILKIKEICVQR